MHWNTFLKHLETPWNTSFVGEWGRGCQPGSWLRVLAPVVSESWWRRRGKQSCSGWGWASWSRAGQPRAPCLSRIPGVRNTMLVLEDSISFMSSLPDRPELVCWAAWQVPVDSWHPEKVAFVQHPVWLFTAFKRRVFSENIIAGP